MGDLGFGLSSPPQQPYLFPPDFLPGQLGNITNHLLVAHGDSSSSSNCTDSCPLDDPQIYQYCHMPLPSNPAAFGQFNPVGSAFQINQSFVECGAEIHDAESFLMHFNAQHRPYFTASTPNPLRAPAGTRHNGHALASTEVMSPPATPLDTSDSGRSSATPSPLTPLSNSVEMTDAKPDSSLHLRGTSTASSVDRSLDLAAEEEHRCLWRDEGSSRICGQLFEDSEELFKHASETHIKHAQKGVQGFRCGWDDCPRSEIGATGFPQRSKIERHMQTHIGRRLCYYTHLQPPSSLLTTSRRQAPYLSHMQQGLLGETGSHTAHVHPQQREAARVQYLPQGLQIPQRSEQVEPVLLPSGWD